MSGFMSTRYMADVRSAMGRFGFLWSLTGIPRRTVVLPREAAAAEHAPNFTASFVNGKHAGSPVVLCAWL